MYHAYNRGVEKRNVFLDEEDYFRFIHDLFEFNDVNPALPSSYQSYEVAPRKIGVGKNKRKPREFLVHILAFTLMPNHFHLLLMQKRENGISEFLRKLSGGYTMYFNQKYERSGVLFQGRFKAALVERDAHFIHLPYYIHANPLDLVMPEWREGNLKNPEAAFTFLTSYKWSSFSDYIGKRNFPSVTQREFLLNGAGNEERYKSDFISWLKSIQLDTISDIIIE
ncbi:transposase [Candidatus Azambacteria bacterium]|nr:transposase [Candidatus Azambacteria bacterium]